MTHKEYTIISAVFALYSLTPSQEQAAWDAITKRWQATSGRFYAYTVAHEIAAPLVADREKSARPPLVW